MKYILCQPAQIRFEWELEVALTSIYSLDKSTPVVLLFAKTDGVMSEQIVERLAARYPSAEVHLYEDTRADRAYTPTIRPFLWYCYLTESPDREKETYFQIDSDVIFKELPDFTKIKATPTTWYGSNCSYYIDYDYLAGCTNGEAIVDNFARIIGIDRSVIEQTEGAGAQWVLVNPTAEYWLKVYNDCNKLFHYLEGVDSDIQKWTAEMWAQLYNAPYFGIKQKISQELDFCRPTDPLEAWDKVKILHNAGVIGDLGKTLFFKGDYFDSYPFQADMSYVDKTKAGIKYVDAIKKVKV